MNRKKTLQAGVIGGNWGRVHITGLRRAGCHVAALVAHDTAMVSAIAAEEQIPNHGSNIDLLSSCDLVTIATPTATHLGFLQQLQNKIIVCEKPLGLTPENRHAFEGLTHKNIYISYPFLHLECANMLTEAINNGQLGNLTRITLVVGVNLPYPKTAVEWFVEDVVHPFSLLFSLFDEFSFQSVQFGKGNNLSVQLLCQGALVDILLCDWPTPGLHFDLTLVGTKNAYQLGGGFRPERGWWFNPLLADDLPISQGEPAVNNPWLEANYKVIAKIVANHRERSENPSINEAGLFDLQRALKMEQLFLPLWEASANHAQIRTPDNTASFRWSLTQ